MRVTTINTKPPHLLPDLLPLRQYLYLLSFLAVGAVRPGPVLSYPLGSQRSKYSGFDLDVELPMESESRETGKGGLVSRFVEVEEVPNGFRKFVSSLHAFHP